MYTQKYDVTVTGPISEWWKLDAASGQADRSFSFYHEENLRFSLVTHKILDRERQKHKQRSRALFRTAGLQ